MLDSVQSKTWTDMKLSSSCCDAVRQSEIHEILGSIETLNSVHGTIMIVGALNSVLLLTLIYKSARFGRKSVIACDNKVVNQKHQEWNVLKVDFFNVFKCQNKNNFQHCCWLFINLPSK